MGADIQHKIWDVFHGMTEQELEIAIQKATPQKPTKYELGGDYYYRCGWIVCDETVRRFWNYCPICGGKIDWSDEE